MVVCGHDVYSRSELCVFSNFGAEMVPVLTVESEKM